MIYLYGLSAARQNTLEAAHTNIRGLQDALQYTSIGPWALIHSQHDDAEVLPKRRLLLAHTRILEAALDCGPILPARFGLVAADLDEVIALATENTGPIAQEFEKIEGAVEIGVRIRFGHPEALHAALLADPILQASQQKLSQSQRPAHFAIAEFGGKLADRMDRRRGDAQRKMISQLSPLCRDYVLRSPESDTEVLRAEFMIDANTLADFETEVSRAAAALTFAGTTEPEIEIIGPVPMYNFVSLNLHFDQNSEAA